MGRRTTGDDDDDDDEVLASASAHQDTIANPHDLLRFRSEWRDELQQLRTTTFIPVVPQTQSHSPSQGSTSASTPAEHSQSQSMHPSLLPMGISSHATRLLKRPSSSSSSAVAAAAPSSSTTTTAAATVQTDSSPNIAITATQLQSSNKEKALALYREGSKFERQGNLSSALKAYRDATRLFPDIERQSADALEVSTNSTEDTFQTYYNFHQNNEGGDGIVDALLDSFQRNLTLNGDHDATTVGYIPKRDGHEVLLARLPGEVVVQIVKWALFLDMSMLIPIALSCKRLYIETRSRTLWKEVVFYFHPHPRITSLASLQLTLDAENVALHSGDWLQMWLDKPRVRFNGVFISRINYVREGRSEGLYGRFLLVTYFRYLRFFTDGSVLCWTTTIDPPNAVRDMIPGVKYQGMTEGRFRLVGSRLYITTRDPESNDNLFYSTMNLSSTKRGKHNKLSWEEYFYERGHNGVKMDIMSVQLKPYIFSRVRSF